MKAKYFKETRVMYIKLYPWESSFGYVKNTKEITDNLLIDFDHEGNPCGIQILNVDDFETDKTVTTNNQDNSE